jgi:hypothetical protein
MAGNTLETIQTKVRRLTRSPSTAQLSVANLNEYINTFVLYDFPEQLRTFTLRQKIKWFTSPNIDQYPPSTDSSDPLFDFANRYITFHEPVYVDGYQIQFSQNREEFFDYYPFINSTVQIATGDGATTTFSGTLDNAPVLRNNVLFESVDVNGDPLRAQDDGAGNFTGTVGGPNILTYTTGAYSFVFSTAPASGQAIYAHTVPYVAQRPRILLYYSNVFTVRPVPDKVYPVELDAYLRPTELLADNQSPELEQWWQYIAYGAAKKIFEDRMDMDSVQMIMPELKKQEALVERRTLVQLANERTTTIYTQQVGLNGSFWRGGPGNI